MSEQKTNPDPAPLPARKARGHHTLTANAGKKARVYFKKGAEDPHGAQGAFTLFSHTLLVTMRMTTMMILIPLVILCLVCAKNYVKCLLALYQ